MDNKEDGSGDGIGAWTVPVNQDSSISRITASSCGDSNSNLGGETNNTISTRETEGGQQHDDDNDLESDMDGQQSLHLKFDVTNTEFLKEADATAVKDAAANKESDSVLSGLNLNGEDDDNSISSRGDDEFESSNNIGSASFSSSQGGTSKRKTGFSRASVRYMEEASFEAAMLAPNRHRLSPSGKAGRVPGRTKSSDSSGIIDFNRSESIGEDQDEAADDSTLGQSENDFFSDEPENKNDNSFSLERRPPLTTVHSMPSSDAGDNYSTDKIVQEDLSEVLKSVGLDISTRNNNEISKYPDKVAFLHMLFQEFSNPKLEIESVDLILKMEQQRGGEFPHSFVDLPTDVVIQKPLDALTQLIGPTLVRLPKDFAMALFRILIRLLTNDTDVEYNHNILTTCAWYDETFSSLPSDSAPQMQRQRTSSLSSVKKRPSFSGIDRTAEARKADQLYNLVRFQRSWRNGVREILNLIETIIEDGTTTDSEYLLPPATRLLGLLCTGSVAVDELRRILALASDGQIAPKTRLVLVNALNVAATGAARSSRLVGKASPRNFFSFSSGTGITRSISLEKTKWPFKNDFGFALWFRAEHFLDSSPVLLRAVNDKGSGIEISLLPLSDDKDDDDSPPATILVISILESGKTVEYIRVKKCVLHARVWYHVAIRHTRSRLKGVFSLKAREQISVMLDGTTMLSESLKFPPVHNSKSLTLTFGKSFDGQTGSLYVFHENVSDATLKALYGLTGGTHGVLHKRDSVHDDWDARRGDIVKKSKVLDLSMRRDDVEDVVLSQRLDNKESQTINNIVADLDEEDETIDNAPLSTNAFNSRLYLVWDPQRTESDVALELHCGAHARMDPKDVQPWTIQSVQNVIGSLGGIQALLPIYRSLLDGSVEKNWPAIESAEIQKQSSSLFDGIVLCSIVPSLLSMLSSFVRNHSENAREMLRCGGIDIVEQLLRTNKNLGSTPKRFPADSLMASLSIFPALASCAIDSLLELRAACSHYIGLESKVFSRVLFNTPLWFGGHKKGIFLYLSLLPVLSSITSSNPEKVRDCVGINDLVQLAKELVEFQVSSSVTFSWLALG